METAIMNTLEEIRHNQDESNIILKQILLAVQTGFLSSEETDEKLFQVLKKDEDYLQPCRKDIRETVAERSLYRAVAGIKKKKRYAKALWYVFQGFEMLLSLITSLKTLLQK